MGKDYKDEIEEILTQAGELNPHHNAPRPSNSIVSKFKKILFNKNWKIAPGYIISIGVILIISYFLFRKIDSSLIPAIGWLGLTLVVFGYSIIFVKPAKTKKTWRGREIDYEKNTWLDSIFKKLKK